MNDASRHSEEMEDLITAPPSWMLRWGVTIFLLILLIIGSLSYYIRYPDTVTAPIVLYSTDASGPLSMTTPGKLRLLVRHGQRVKQGTCLAYIERPAAQAPHDTLGAIYAPCAGGVALIGLPENGQMVAGGMALCYVRSDSAVIYGKLSIAQQDINKIQRGQAVVIKLQSYQFERFGVLHGSLDLWGELPDAGEAFVAKVNLNPPIPQDVVLKEGLMGGAEIILQERSLLDRFLGNIRKAVSGKKFTK